MLRSYKHAHIAEFCKNTDHAGANLTSIVSMGRRDLRMSHLGEGMRSQVIPVRSEPFDQKQGEKQFHLLHRKGEKREERVRRQVREFLRHAQLGG